MPMFNVAAEVVTLIEASSAEAAVRKFKRMLPDVMDPVDKVDAFESEPLASDGLRADDGSAVNYYVQRSI
jgi:hypothetical protein